MLDLQSLQEKLGVSFRDTAPLERVLQHYLCHTNSIDEVGYRQRLELLGDAVLRLVVTDHLHRRDSTKGRSMERTLSESGFLLSNRRLAWIACCHGLDEFVIAPEKVKMDRELFPSVIADVMEMIIGAFFSESGYNDCQKLITRVFLTEPSIAKANLCKDFVRLFRQKVQEHLGETLDFHYESRTFKGNQRHRHFVGAWSNGTLLSIGWAETREQAEMQAALIALRRKGWL